MEPNRKSNYSYIERVNDHRSCYWIKTNDGLKLELDKSEIGRFIPQKGMSVQIRLFNGTVLQEVFLDGICVVRRSPQKLLDILAGLSAELRKAQDECEKFSALENSDGYLNLPLAFRHRLQLLKLIMQKDFTAATMEKQIVVCQIAAFLSAQTNAFIACVERDWQKRLGDSVPVSKLSEKELMDAKQLALALRRDKRNRFKSVRDYQQSAVLSFKGNSAPYALRAQDAVERYLSAALAG